MFRYGFGTKNHLLNCILNMSCCALTQAVLHFYSMRDSSVVAYVIATHFILAIGCIICVVGEINMLKMELEKNERLERFRSRFGVLETIWFVLMMMTLSVLSFAFKNL